MRKSLWIIAILAAFLMSTAAARADVTYCYKGNNFVADGTLVSPITTSDYVSGCVTLTGAIASSTILTDYKPELVSVSFSFLPTQAPLITSTAYVFNLFFQADGAGNIQYWIVGVQSPSDLMETNNIQNVQVDDFADHAGGGFGEIYNDHGTWTELASTPEPATAVLWLTGIVLMILTRKRIAHLIRLDTGTQGSPSPH